MREIPRGRRRTRMMKGLDNIQRRPYLLLVLATLFWGSNFVFGKLLVQTIPPFHLSVSRWLIGLLLFLPFAIHEWMEHQKTIKKEWKKMICLAFTGVAGFNSLLYVGVQYTTSINASLINSTAPLLIILLSVFFLRDKLLKLQYIGAIMSVVGVMWVFSEGQLERLLSFSFNRGDVLVIIAVISWAIYSVLMKKWGSLLPKKATFLTTIVLGICILFPFAVMESFNHTFSFNELSPLMWLGLIYLGICPSILSFICWNEGVMQVGPAKSSNFLHLIVVFAGFFAFVVGETYSVIQFTGGVIILIGVIMASNPTLFQRLLKKEKGTFHSEQQTTKIKNI